VPVTSLGAGIRVEWLDFYGDGTMTASLSDLDGRRAAVCLDGRANGPTQYRLFEQAGHPRGSRGLCSSKSAARRRASWCR